MVKVPTVSIDKTDGCMIYLSKDSLNTQIVTAKSSEMNILIPDDTGDFVSCITNKLIFTARCYASAVYMPCSCVCPSICSSQADVGSQWLNAGSRKQWHMNSQRSLLSRCERFWQNLHRITNNVGTHCRLVG